ncbi:MAG: T9SS type A sorting domain-containing protein [Bacteroidota bacterium]
MLQRLLFCWFLLAYSLLSAQSVSLRRWLEIPFFHSGQLLPNAQTGGLNEAQFSPIDLDGSGEMDLFIFDRSGDQVLTFVADPSTESGYRYRPELESVFPAMQHWALLRDLNCDGLPEILTSRADSNGVRIFRNTSQGGNLSFELWTDLLATPSGKVYAAISDIPGIADVDNDGDLDLLSFDPGGSQVRWYENLANGDCQLLSFAVGSNCWGEFSEAGLTNDITLDVACKRGEGEETPPAHAGSTICAFDQDGDQAIDLLLGDLNNVNLVFLHNGGTAGASVIDQAIPDYPTNSTPVSMRQFPGAFHLDVRGDGLKDLLVTPNISSISRNAESVWYYRNVGSANNQIFSLQQTDFLQEEMIELGRSAKPAFVDYNQDGLMDLVVGNYLYRAEALQEVSRLSLYRNNGTPTEPSFERVTNDYLNLSTLFNPPRLGLHPTFGDLDNDGDPDLILGDENGNLHHFVNTASVGQTANFQLFQTLLAGIDVGGNAAPQIVDLDRDGRPDLLVGERSGTLNWFRNIGTPSLPEFHQDSVDDFFGEIDVLTDCCTGYSVPFVFENDQGQWELLVGTEFNELRHYPNLGDLSGAFPLETLQFGDIQVGSRVAPQGADLNQDGKWDWAIGNERGGLALFQADLEMSAESAALPEAGIKLFPNPAEDYVTIQSMAGTSIQGVRLLTFSGQIMLEKKCLPFQSSAKLPLSDIPPGIYLIEAFHKEGTFVSKIIKR